MPSAGNLQHLALAAAKFKGFYNEMGVTNAQLVFLRGNAVNVQALVAGSVPFASAFGPAMHAMFRGEQIRIILQIFNQIPFGLIVNPEIKRLEDLKGKKIGNFARVTGDPRPIIFGPELYRASVPYPYLDTRTARLNRILTAPAGRP